MNAHIFIDAENIPPEVGFRTVAKFRRDYSIYKVDIIGKKDSLSQKYLTAGEPYHVQNCYYGKNSADTWLCVEYAKTIYEELEIETIIIVSSDRDFLPAIKLAVEKNKNMIVVSNGSGHRNLRKLLRELQIDIESVQLVDYRDGLNIPDDSKKKKRSLSSLMQNAQPVFIDLNDQKLKKFYKRMSPSTENFFRKREDKIKFIFVKNGAEIFEIPFVDGMSATAFSNLLKELRIVKKKSSIDTLILNSLLLQKNKKIYLRNFEEIISEQVNEKSSPFDDLSLETLQYFTDNNLKVKIIFVKFDENIFEIPFVDGMDAEIFLQVLFEKQLIETFADFEKIIEESFLKISDEKIFLLTEDEMQTVEEENSELQNLQTIFIKFGGEFIEVPFFEGIGIRDFLEILSYYGIVGDHKFIEQIIFESMLDIRADKIYFAMEENNFSEGTMDIFGKLSSEAQKFIAANESRLKFINLTYQGYFYDVPFVNGIAYSRAAKILLDLKIINKFEEARKVFIGNGFQIINGSVYP